MRRPLIVFCFLLSGIAGLIDEVIWIKKASLIFGSTTYAVSTVLAVFFAGLALGSEIFGRLGRRIDDPIKVYALLEVVLAGMVLLSLPAFGWLETPYGSIFLALGGGDGVGNPALLLLVRVLLVAVVLLPPTVAMGGTLPLFVRSFVVSGDHLSTRVGFLYGINTLGAAMGAAAAGFWLLPWLGMQGAITVAAVISAVAGILAYFARSEKRVDLVAQPEPEQGSSIQADRRLLGMALLFLMTGMAALAAEVVWTRFLSLMIRHSVTTYTLALATVLVGIVIGSWLAARLWDRKVPLAPAYAMLQAGAGLGLLYLTGLSADFWLGLGSGLTPFVLLMLPPAILSGASFPLAVRLATTAGADATRTVGRLTALNTSGGILGSLVAGFWLLPTFGISISLQVVTGLSVLGAVLALVLIDRPAGRSLVGRWAGAAVIIGLWLTLPMLSSTRLPQDYIAHSGHVMAVAEGQGSTLAVVLRDGERQLLIDRLWQGKKSKGHQIMAAHVPALLHPDPDAVLVIGLGVGQTASRFLMHGIGRLDVVDIEPAIFPFVRVHFDCEWMDDPRVTIIADDGRTFTAHSDRGYDLISIEVGQVFRPGVDAFYTQEFYTLAAQQLNDGGLVAQFVPLPFLGETEFRRILATFLKIFPDAVLWYNQNELLLIGGKPGALNIDPDRFASVTCDSQLRDDLAWSHWGGRDEFLHHPANLLAGMMSTGDELTRLAAGALPYEDDHPDLAYSVGIVEMGSDRMMGMVELVASHLSPWPESWRMEIRDGADQMRHGNMAELKCGGMLSKIHDRLGELGFVAALRGVTVALKQHPDNLSAQQMHGEILNLGGQFEKAVPVFQDIINRDGGRLDARRGLALAMSRTNRLQEAIIELQVIIAANPDDARALNYMGACQADLGHLQEAERFFQKSTAIDPTDQNTLDNLNRLQDILKNRR